MRRLKELREYDAIRQFIYYFKANQISDLSFATKERPHPDCLVTISNVTIWIEETTIIPISICTKKYIDTCSEQVKELVYAIPDKTKYPQIIIDMILNSIQKKDRNNEYTKLVDIYGKGVLLITITCPFFSWENDLKTVVDPKHYSNLIQLTKFKSVYIVGLIQGRRPKELLIWPCPSYLIFGEHFNWEL